MEGWSGRNLFKKKKLTLPQIQEKEGGEEGEASGNSGNAAGRLRRERGRKVAFARKREKPYPMT